MGTTKYGIIMAQHVHFVTTLTVPLTGTGVLYPRVRDLFYYGIQNPPKNVVPLKFFFFFFKKKYDVCKNQTLIEFIEN